MRNRFSAYTRAEKYPFSDATVILTVPTLLLTMPSDEEAPMFAELDLTRKSDVANALEALIVKAGRKPDPERASIYHEGIHALIAALSGTSDAALDDESENERLRRELSMAKVALAEAEGEGVEARRASIRAKEASEKEKKEAAKKAVEKERERVRMGSITHNAVHF